MGLLDIIKKNKSVRKIFGKAELEIIERQLLGINLTQSEKNRLSRDIRKKLEVIKELSIFQDEFGLKKGAHIKEMVEDAKEVILESKHLTKIKRIILFGSTTENQRSFRSDIDIAVEFDSIDKKEATEFRIKTLGKVSNMVDIQVYNILPDKIKKEIEEKGRVLYKNED